MVPIRLAALLFFSSALSFAGSWSGALVDSKCYANEESNHPPNDTLTAVDQDRNWEIRYCSPSAKTKSFAVVQRDGLSFKLDPAGNAKASDLVRTTGKKRVFEVDITGQTSGGIIKVDSISAAK